MSVDHELLLRLRISPGFLDEDGVSDDIELKGNLCLPDIERLADNVRFLVSARFATPFAVSLG